MGIKGKANIKPKWVPNEKDPMKNIGEGGRGICCAELDLWEANKQSYQLALHPMDGDDAQKVCYLEGECGSQETGHRNDGPTDRNGCYMNPYLMGHKKFYGPGADYTINTEKPFTIVTEFRDDGKGHLAGMHQFSKPVERGMTMVLSFWDDMATDMNWLDTGARGRCNVGDGDPKTLREKHPDAKFGIRHLRWGPIGSTHKKMAEAMIV